LISDEGTKEGIPMTDALGLVSYIRDECPMLNFSGLMSMGKLNDVEGFRVNYII
jgi:uncharacterized pyridoxal phosphate-containing UPF0001 family protein